MIYSETQYEQAQDDEYGDELVLIGLKVNDDVGMIPTSSFDQSIHFPQPRTTLCGGRRYVVLMPDSGLSGLYNDVRMEVFHDPAEIAKCMLDSNYLSSAVFNRESAVYDIRELVFDQMGLEDKGFQEDNYEYRTQLREIAGFEDPEVSEDKTQTRAEELMDEYKYTEMKTLASDMGIDNANQKKTVLAEWIAENEGDDSEDEE